MKAICFKKNAVMGQTINLLLPKPPAMRRLLVFIIFVLWAIPAFAQVDTAWVRRYNGPSNSDDCARGIVVDGTGNVYVTGWSFDNSTWDDYTTIKYDASGSQMWVRRYSTAGSDWASGIGLDGSGNIYVTGVSYSGSGYTTIKYDPSGNEVWVRTYNALQGGGSAYLAVDNSGNTYVTGESGNYPDFDYTTIKYNSGGSEIWVRKYNGPGNLWDRPSAIAIDCSVNVIVTGVSGFGYFENGDYATIKYNASGSQIWVRRYNGPANGYDGATGITKDVSGNVYVTGSSEGSGTGTDYATIKYDSTGNEIWVRRYNGTANENDGAWAIAIDSSGNVYVTGSSSGSGTDKDYATIKYDPDGNEIWVRRYNGTANGGDFAWVIAIVDSGNVYVTGDSPVLLKLKIDILV